MSLRVLHLSPTWFGDASVRGGGERYPLELARAMSRQTPTRLVSFGPRESLERVDGFEIEVLARTHLASTKDQFWLTADLDVYESKERVLSKRWSVPIPRNGI